MLISIIIPTLNEEKYIGETLTFIINHRANTHVEIIVVDSGSTDNTIKEASKYEVKVYNHPELKGQKFAILNKGSSYAQGDVFAFLDADTIVPRSFDLLIIEALSNPKNVGGAFHMRFDHRTWFLRLIEMLNYWRYKWSQEYYGDQMVFCRRDIFNLVKGYPARKILESSYFCKSLLKHGKLKLIKPAVVTSSRRFHQGKGGPLGVFINDVRIYILDKLGKNTNRYGDKYWQLNERGS